MASLTGPGHNHVGGDRAVTSKTSVLAINLDKDVERLAFVRREVENDPAATFRRVPGLLGRGLSDLACHLLTKNADSHNHKGTLGCFLSHVLAWETLLREELPAALVIEDDVHICRLDLLHGFQVPDGCDIVFCNDRTAYPGQDTGIALRSLEPVLRHVDRHGKGVGGDGYLLTKAGAARLLRFVELDGLFSHVDIRLLAYCLDPDVKRDATSHSIGVRGVVNSRVWLPKAHRLSGLSLYPPVVERRTLASTRDFEDRFARQNPPR